MRHEAIAWTQPAPAAAVSEKHDATGVRGNAQVAFERVLSRSDAHKVFADVPCHRDDCEAAAMRGLDDHQFRVGSGRVNPSDVCS